MFGGGYIMLKKYNIFPNIVLEDKAELISEIKKSIREEIKSIENSGLAEETPFGWVTNNKRGLQEKSLKSLCLLLGQIFSKNIGKVYDTRKLQIDIIEPQLICIKPGHMLPLTAHNRRWYSGCIWLQTSNKGSGIYFKDMGPRHFVGPDCVDRDFALKPQENKCVFWPRHVPHGFYYNDSQIDNYLIICTFRAPVKQ